MSPGWHESAPQTALSVEKRIARAPLSSQAPFLRAEPMV
jgi:hypothetical protein